MKAAEDFLVNYNYYSGGATKILRPWSGFQGEQGCASRDIQHIPLKRKRLECSDVRL
jgi:hypothetical protein